ncbi:GNAT family N-acetyltransferase, partial [Candidatus Saccharibacteria bacterium]|nr:GNAT family N-acetyltransferase [Candidatus Saccharibacteria bacterium]NIV03571.1 GNAT family N-acetyltransferase [Calditrichia bacterium]NIV71848.1 GNAT family N-acetyltransferase [Calditrichia bacterium]NIV98594.1 GNAT family N-acetyltransferase [Candidatus Saccharibacteria bacterium]NIW78849.1 GNAT family N-acetyltransferase [Calditrichia bacterium]
TANYFQFPLDKKQLKKHLRNTKGSKPECLIFKVVSTSNGKAIGHIELDRIDRQAKKASVCRVLIGDETLRGKGICKMMMEKILNISFNQLGLEKVFLNVMDYNVAAINCYKKVGFSIERLIEQSCHIGNKYLNSYRMSLSVDRWRNFQTDVSTENMTL